MLIKKNKKDYFIDDLSYSESFNIKKDNVIYYIYDKKIINKLIDDKFWKKYNLFASSDDEDGDLVRSIERFESIIINKYFKYISKNKLNKYIGMLELLKEDIIIRNSSYKSR